MAIPTVDTFTSSRALKAVTLSADIDADGGETVTATGFEIGVDSGVYTIDVAGSATTGTFTGVANLEPGKYYARAFATNVDGDGYSEEIIFYVYGQAATVNDSDGVIEQVMLDQTAAGYDFAGISPSNKVGKVLLIFVPTPA